MAKYEKWLGAGLGFVVGGPMGSMIGYAAGEQIGKPAKKYSKTAHTSEFETNLILLASAVIKADGRVTREEMAFVRGFFTDHFDPAYIDEKMAILEHCLERQYDTRKACGDIRISASMSTRIQIIHFLFDIAIADADLSQRERDTIFVIAGWLNINDIEFNRIRQSYVAEVQRYNVFGLLHTASFDEIKTAYRKMVLEYHPDRNIHLPPAEQKAVAEKFRKIQEAFDQIRVERGVE
ncbi:MAG: TerB family tellurite resistance protein [Bacteroidetes bacterium]|nr:TerB family tellurite resistance protein [Bacteroidota bacterium]